MKQKGLTMSNKALRDEWEKQMIARTANMTDQQKQESWDGARSILREVLTAITKCKKNERKENRF